MDVNWKGSRGEWYLVVQAMLFVLLLFGPDSCQWLDEWQSPFTWIGSWAGGFLLCMGALLAGFGTLNLGRNLTPLPFPKEHAQLVSTGAYRFVRHPIYSGIIAMAYGWGLWRNSWLITGYALLLFIFFDIKSRFEECLLGEKFPEYAAYQKRVRKLIPFLY
ncbi:MAG: isoprenylcysteine carboxylmethyltransferase family protein [Desulfuromonadaceae bacterium]|nr:isoprenylcysteine carboxylmethyltransferase family protein [Desulfuromonadaceae bacterium]MDD5107202.1 isoprenylcysteine carboxylmethyltransferase family protein [Desulfuromonadaceae bacterium]